MPGFVHLHNHSEYSLLDAIARCPDIAARCKELGFESYALTDHGVMYGALEFYLAMRDAGLKPILGCEFYVAARRLTDKDPQLDRRNRHLVLLARDTEGYRNLMKLTSIAHTEGFYYKPRVDLEAVREHRAGLVALTACPGGVVAAPFHHEGEEQAYQALTTYLDVFGADNLFLEIQYHYLEMEDRYRQWARDAAKRAGVRLVATNDCHYVYKEDARAHDIALCLRDKKLLTDSDRQKYSGPEYYIKSEAEMRELHADYQDALDNTAEVAALCNLELDLDEVHFPNLELPSADLQQLRSWQPPAAAVEAVAKVSEQTPEESSGGIKVVSRNEEQQQEFADYLRMRTYEGAARRYGGITPELSDRIEYELSVIIDKGFSTYFLICAEFCNWARGQDIPVGPGRGSAAGSVVAYSLEITDLDPIKYGLYFERFLNPERIELPDFDIDFCKRRRDEVIDHVKEKYGADKVALIITFSRLKARAVIKAVGRTKGLEFQYVNRVTNEIHGLNPTIDDALANSAELQQMISADAEIRELIEDARKLEGIAAYHSVHAAGLVISPEELPSFVPVQRHKDTNMLVTQYSMDCVPYTGLVKFDFLGLRNLTLIQDTAEYIEDLEGRPIDPRHLPDCDEQTYAALQRGDGYGVFQFEAPQVKRMLIEGRPENVVDLAAINAANRPGPIGSGNTERYLQNRRAGREGVSLYPSIAKILEPTGGVLLFQEQVMEIARELAGYSLGEADVLRKAMGKKKAEIMDEQKRLFLAGAAQRNVPAREAGEIWDMMEKFAGYGFNKAHSTCYSWISYQTAYLKTHYPHYFMAAMLNNNLGNSDKLAEILAQCKKMQIPVLPPSVNAGGFSFTPRQSSEIIFGLGGIKGIGESAVKAILEQRRLAGPFKTLEGFFNRTRKTGVNKKVLQSLAMAGAFDCLLPDRKELIRNIDDIEGFLRGPDRQEALFGGFDEETESTTLLSREVTDMDVAMMEKQAIGLFLTNHPFEDHPIYSDARHLQLADLQQSVVYDPTRWQDKPLPSKGLAGLLTEVKLRLANTSQKMYAKARLEDPERSVSIIIWPKAYEDARQYVEENAPVVIWGKLQLPEVSEEHAEAWDQLEIVVDRIKPYAGDQSPSGENAKIDASSGQGNGSLGNGSHKIARPSSIAPAAEPGAAHPQAEHHAVDAFSPLPINWEIDLGRATSEDLVELAHALEECQGDREVCMKLREVSGQLKRIKAGARFSASLDAAQRLERKFPFIIPLPESQQPG